MCRYWDMPAPYYSFCAGGVRFIVLDTNWVHTANGLIDLAYEKSSLYPGSKQRYLSQVQLAWLQQTSYEAQVKHYIEHIKSKEHTDNWQFVDVYTDKGITGTSTKKREGFNRMIQDALAGKIDLIITKSVSRFARNTVDTLTTIRKLKEHGVEVYFEEQNIYTLDGKGEVLLTIMSSIAQEESRNISENVTWGMRKRFAEGKVTMAYKQFMGYRRGKNGIPEAVEAEAKIIRTIFRRFLEGATP
ncbi:MAG: recombinase family protein, partial [Clostridia bacterium]|nr:recombinase family protein [Clostridia bacterium]